MVFSTLSLINQTVALRQSMVVHLELIAESIAEQYIAHLNLRWADGSGSDILAVLKNDPDIEVAVIYDGGSAGFEVYLNPRYVATSSLPLVIPKDGSEFIFDRGAVKYELFRSILFKGDKLGTLYILSNTNKLTENLKQSIFIMIFSFVLALAGALLVATRLQKLITRPVFSLASTARNITEKGDYSVRVTSDSSDEIGSLVADFNFMLETIQNRDKQLNEHRQNLENLVKIRTEELRIKRDEALAASKAKSEFLANMSHEIRTPMNGIVGALSLMKGEANNTNDEDMLITAKRSADVLMKIINDILDFSKIDAGKVEFESIRFNLRGLVEEVAELFMSETQQKDLEIVNYVSPEISNVVVGDPTRLRQIVTNLLSNSVKFTEYGSILIHVGLDSTSSGDGLVLRFSVEDTGIGIKQEVVSKLFDKFTQADGSTTRKFGGTGLGLSVCKQLVELQGGEIGVKSRPGHGSIFWFTLPFKSIGKRNAEKKSDGLQGKKYVYVGHNNTNMAILRSYIKHLGGTLEPSVGIPSYFPKNMSGCIVDFNKVFQTSELLLQTKLVKLESQFPGRFILLARKEDMPDLIEKTSIRKGICKPIRLGLLYETLVGTSVLPIDGDPADSREDAQINLRGKVLLVDDELINRKVALAILRKFGLQADYAINGLEATRMIEKNEYSLILMDIHMPEMSGFGATQEIRKREKVMSKKRVTIIAMTANATEQIKEQCFEAGMDDFLTKPIKPETLAARISPWLSSDSCTEAPVENIQEDNCSETIPQDWDRVKALEYLGGDKVLLKEMISTFISRNSDLLHEIERAIKNQNSRDIQNAAHAYKGAVGHFAASMLKKAATELEQHGAMNEMAGAAEKFQILHENSRSLLKELKKEID